MPNKLWLYYFLLFKTTFLTHVAKGRDYICVVLLLILIQSKNVKIAKNNKSHRLIFLVWKTNGVMLTVELTI